MVGGSNPGRGTVVGGVLKSNQATGKVFSAEYVIYGKIYKNIWNYTPYASPSFKVAKPLRIIPISAIIITIRPSSSTHK